MAQGQAGIGRTFNDKQFRGLNPVCRLLTWKGGSYALDIKRTVNKAADSLQAYIKGLYRAAGLPPASSHSGHRTFASHLLVAGESLETVQALLGHVMPYLELTSSPG